PPRPGIRARWKIVSGGSRSTVRQGNRSIEPRTTSAPGTGMGVRWTRQVVRTPAATSLLTRGTPMNPVPPSTSAVLSERLASSVREGSKEFRSLRLQAEARKALAERGQDLPLSVNVGLEAVHIVRRLGKGSIGPLPDPANLV